MAFLPHDRDQLAAEIVADCTSPLVGKVGAVALPDISVDLLESFAKSALDFLAKTYGDQLGDLILEHKDTIRSVIGPAVLEAADRVVHGLQDLKITPPRRSDPV